MPPAARAAGLLAVFIILPTFPADATAQQAAAQLDTVQVTVTSRASPSLATPARSVQVITRAEIERTPARTISDVLAMRLGVDVRSRSPAQADLSLRGSSIEQVLVLVDGVRMSDAQAGHYDLDLAVPLDLVQRIEVLRGTGSTLYGPDAVGGVINIITRRDSAFASARLRSGSFGTVGASAVGGDTLNGVGVQGGANIARSDGDRSGTDYRIGQAHLSLDHAAGSGRVRAELGLGIRSFGAADFYGAFPSSERTGTSTASLRYTSDPSARWRLSATASARRHTDRFTLVRDNPAIYENHHLSWQTAGEAVARYAASPSAALAFGTDVRDDQLASDGLGHHREELGALFAEATLGRARGASLDAGVRVDWSSRTGHFVSPSVAGAVPLAHDLWLRGSVGRGFRAPTWTELYYRDPENVGDPSLHPETFTAGEVGLRAIPAGRVRLDLAVYARHADDLIDWARPAAAPDSTPWHTRNVESATYHGVELDADVPHLLGADWTVHASGLAFDAHGADGTTGKYALRPLTHSIGLTVTAPVDVGTRASLDVRDARRVGERAHFEANARLTHEWAHAWVQLDVLNITGVEYLDASVEPVAGRALYIGMGWRE
ncbi:MAG TPA: TonB-dependent receptor [Gemmatimonadaceae bacterium]|nr:TonB-dependent receptor [Gemmatimonadaceae bacterium]